MRVLGDVPGGAVITGGTIQKVEVVNKYGYVITQAAQGEQIQWKITYSLTSAPPETFSVVFEIANPDKPGTTHTGIWATAYGDGRILTKTTTGVLMPSHDIRYYVTYWDANWKLIAESPVQTLRYTPPPPPPPPPPTGIEPVPPPEVYPPPEVEPPADEAPPEGPPVWQPLRYLIWLLFGG